MIRLDKYLADAAGLTRSEAARMIRSGMAAVNGSVIRRPEQKFDENTAAVTLNGTPCSYRRFWYYLLDKPTGLITASRDGRQETVLDLFPPEIRKRGIAPVGRLDKDTSGLLLLTNDGEFAHRVISPRYAVSKVYHATVEQPLEAKDPERFQSGLILADGTKCLPAELEILGERTCLVTACNGAGREVSSGAQNACGGGKACRNPAAPLRRPASDRTGPGYRALSGTDGRGIVHHVQDAWYGKIVKKAT